MNIIKTFFVVSVFLSASIALSGCGALPQIRVQKSVQANVETNEHCQCYWMENYSGQYKWVPHESIRGTKNKISKAMCYALDSCDGGLGQSHGGCYKWALGPESNRIAW